MGTSLEEYCLSKYERDLSITSTHVPEYENQGYTDMIHQAIPVALGGRILGGDREYSDIFGVRDISRILTEGYEFSNGIITEDFVFTSPEEGGKMALGQVVSSNGKEKLGDKPFDVIQAENFERKIGRDNSIDPDIAGIYTVRTALEPADVEEAEKEVREAMEENREYVIPIRIMRLETPEPIDWAEVNSVLHKN